MKKRIIVGASGASGMPLLKECLKLIREAPDYESWLIMTDSAKLTLSLETEDGLEDTEALADYVLRSEEIGAGPASGSFRTEGMLVVPCSMKTAAGIRSSYTDNLLLRAADVTIKEQRTLVLAAREAPLSAIHLKNLCELAMLPSVRIIPPMVSFYQRPESLEDMVHQIACRLVEPFGIDGAGFRRWEDESN